MHARALRAHVVALRARSHTVGLLPDDDADASAIVISSGGLLGYSEESKQGPLSLASSAVFRLDLKLRRRSTAALSLAAPCHVARTSVSAASSFIYHRNAPWWLPHRAPSCCSHTRAQHPTVTHTTPHHLLWALPQRSAPLRVLTSCRLKLRRSPGRW